MSTSDKVLFVMASAVVFGVLLNLALEPVVRYLMAAHP